MVRWKFLEDYSGCWMESRLMGVGECVARQETGRLVRKLLQ